MIKEKLLLNYEITSVEMKNDFVEWLVICNYMDEDDFNNIFRLSELGEEEFFRILDFLWKQECFNILFMIITRHLNRFKNDNLSVFEHVEINECVENRIRKLNDFIDFKTPKML